MKKNDTNKIDDLASRAFAGIIEGNAQTADSQNAQTGSDALTVAPVPEYRLKFRMCDRTESGPEILPYVAAALALFMFVPALFTGSEPTIEKSFVSACNTGKFVSFTDEFKDTMIRVSLTLRN